MIGDESWPQLLRLALHVGPQPGGEGGFVEGSGGKAEDGLRGIFFGGGKTIAVHFEQQDTDDKARALVPIDERMVTDNAGRVSSSEGDHVGIVAIGVKLLWLWSGKGGFKKSLVAYALGATVEGEKAVMKRAGVSLVYPDRLPHLASACRVFR